MPDAGDFWNFCAFARPSAALLEIREEGQPTSRNTHKSQNAIKLRVVVVVVVVVSSRYYRS